MQGHLVIADISGYTRFLTETELDHANGIIGELLNSIIGAIHAPLTVSSIEGDAVFMYGSVPEGTVGQHVIESVELLYCAFASALETMTLNTSCRCNACANISNLGLKIVMHCGEFLITDVGGREMLSGPDVIMIHRLLKNHVREATGIADYMLVTQKCVDDLDAAPIVAGWTEHTEEYEHVGEVKGYVSSLPDVWNFVRQQNEDKVLQRDAWMTLTAHSAAPPIVVWDHLVDPVKRTAWLNATENTITGLQGGRIGPGSEYHCAHGDDELVVFTVLDRRAVDYVTFVIPVGEGIAMRYTDYVIASGGGTRIVSYAARPFMTYTGEPASDEMSAAIHEYLSESYAANLQQLAEMAANAVPVG